jgi:hypothetical protein
MNTRPVPLNLEELDYGLTSAARRYVKAPCPEYGSSPPPRRLSFREKTDLLVAIFSLQRPEGGLELDEKVASTLGLDLREIRRVARKLTTLSRENRTALLHTAILLSVLEAYFQGDADLWQQVFAKTSNWLDRVLGRGIPLVEGVDLFDWAKSYVQERVRI